MDGSRQAVYKSISKLADGEQQQEAFEVDNFQGAHSTHNDPWNCISHCRWAQLIQIRFPTYLDWDTDSCSA